MDKPLSPKAVLRQISEAMPDKCRKSVVIVGSLAAGYYYFGNDSDRSLRTKDADCMISPHAMAAGIAKDLTEDLINAGWQIRKDSIWGSPGTPETPENALPLVRLHPPEQTEWFLELLGSPSDETRGNAGRHFERIETSRGHFALCSFDFLRLVECGPISTEFEIQIARPEMMALANLLHHPEIGSELIGTPISGRTIRRSNKDLGRVLALAYLQATKSLADLEGWPRQWHNALAEKYQNDISGFVMNTGNGLRMLLENEDCLEEALWTCNNGLLSSNALIASEFKATGKRFIADVIIPFEKMANNKLRN